MPEKLKTTKEVVEEKLKNAAKTDEEFLQEFKKDHEYLTGKIMQSVKDIDSIKSNPEKLDVYNMMTMQVQAMNLYSYFTAILIKMLEVQKITKAAKDAKSKEEK